MTPTRDKMCYQQFVGLPVHQNIFLVTGCTDLTACDTILAKLVICTVMFGVMLRGGGRNSVMGALSKAAIEVDIEATTHAGEALFQVDQATSQLRIKSLFGTSKMQLKTS